MTLPTVRQLVQPEQFVECQQVATCRQEARPCPGIELPEAGGAQVPCLALANELTAESPNVAQLAMLHTAIHIVPYVAIATKSDLGIAVGGLSLHCLALGILNLVDAMKHIVSWLDFSQHHVAHLKGFLLGENGNVALAFHEWAHALTFGTDGHVMPFCHQSCHMRQELSIG